MSHARIIIGFASQTGTAGNASKRLFDSLKQQFEHVELYCLNRFDEFLQFLGLENTYFIVVTSTFGKGESPMNGRKFEKFIKEVKDERFDKLRFAVLGYGSSLFPVFCGFSKLVDQTLGKLRAKRLMQRLDADAANPKR
jgi:sulfite reductase (NADPH) flavoprotein alpha-component